MNKRGLILELRETDEEIINRIASLDVMTLVQKNRSKEFFVIEQIARRDKKLILLISNISSLRMEMRIQNTGKDCHLIKYVGKGKCELMKITYADENMW